MEKVKKLNIVFNGSIFVLNGTISDSREKKEVKSIECERIPRIKWMADASRFARRTA